MFTVIGLLIVAGVGLSSAPAFAAIHSSNTEHAYYEYTTRPLTSFYGQWTVPTAPLDGSEPQTIVLWIGLMCCYAPTTGGGYDLLQPVLQWSSGSGWIIYSEYVNANGIPILSNSMRVAVGDTIAGSIERGFCNINCSSYWWTITIEDLKTGTSTSLKELLPSRMTSAFVAMESSLVDDCQDYPRSGSTQFSTLLLTDTNGGYITPSWAPYVPTPDCGMKVVVGSSSSVTLYY